MTSDNQRLVAPNAAIRPITTLQSSDRVSETAFDDAIRAQLSHVVIGVRGAARRTPIRSTSTITSAETVTMVVELAIYLSLSEAQFGHAQGCYKSGVLLIPAGFDQAARSRVADPWNAVEEAATRWKSVCTANYSSVLVRSDTLQSAMGEAFTLRLVFDAHNRAQASDLADGLCIRFGAWHQLTTSLREALKAIRSALLEPQVKNRHYVPLLYCGAQVTKGWTKRIVDPASFLHCDAIEQGWSEPRVPSELSDLFAARCEVVWSDTAKLLQAAALDDDDQDHDDAPSSDAADEFVCADRMMSLWYSEKKRRCRRG